MVLIKNECVERETLKCNFWLNENWCGMANTD